MVFDGMTAKNCGEKNYPDQTVGSEVSMVGHFHHTKHVSMPSLGPADTVGKSGHQVVTNRSPSGHQVVTKWSPRGHQVVTKWLPSGHQVVSWSRMVLVLDGIQWYSMVFNGLGWSRMVLDGLGWSVSDDLDYHRMV